MKPYREAKTASRFFFQGGSMLCRGLRGATTADSNKSEEILARTKELLEELQKQNGFQAEDLASIWFTTTRDLNAAFPAQAARALGWTETPMMCSQEIDVPGSLPRCIRVMIHWNTKKNPAELHHLYLRGAGTLRPDLADKEGALTRTEAHYASPASIAFQGEPGAFSEETILYGLGNAMSRLACHTFADVFLAVVSGRVEAGMLPMENSTTGSIHTSYDLLLEYNLHAIGEFILPVRHFVMVPPGVEMDQVKQVISHPQALDQCSRWITAQGWEPVPVHDTAGAARMLAEEKRTDRAAIASETAAELYGLNIVARSIQDIQANYTRFLLLSKDTAPIAPPTKSSLIFATKHKPGALHACLNELAKREINLTKIESRPDRRTPWHYLFYLDFMGTIGDPKIEQTLDAMRAHTEFQRFIGSYPTKVLIGQTEE
jgi:monofunctional chorismate mutase